MAEAARLQQMKQAALNPQQLQATRHARRVYVGGLPKGFGETELTNYLNQVGRRAGGGGGGRQGSWLADRSLVKPHLTTARRHAPADHRPSACLHVCQTTRPCPVQLLMAAGGCSHPGPPVMGVYINADKRYGFVELRTTEEASTALALDGLSCRVRRRPRAAGGRALLPLPPLLPTPKWGPPLPQPHNTHLLLTPNPHPHPHPHPPG
jgi:hypothetical protein